MWSVYLIRTHTGSLYTGISTDVDRRFREHQDSNAKTARSLRGKGPLRLVFRTEVGDRSEALKVEYSIKQLPKSKKESLIRGEIGVSDVVENPP